jgi:hypothetical protein
VKTRVYFRCVVRYCLLLLGALQIAAMLVAFERPALAYVDPGSGFVFLQVAGSMCAGAIYYLRHRLRRMLYSSRPSSTIASPASPQTEVAENQP